MKPIKVLIPVYNAEAFIQDTIESVLCQTFSEFELLAMDDGSTDNSAAIIQSYADPRVRYVPCMHDFIATINQGLELADSKYIALIDHDDIMMPNRLKTQFDFMEANPDIAACGGYMHSFGIKPGMMKVPLTHPEIIKTMLLYSPILNPTGFIRRQVLTDNNIRYQRGYYYSADYKLWSDIAKIGQLATIPKVLTLYRKHSEQTSVKYLDKCLEGGQKVKFEMFDFFISRLKQGNEWADAIIKDFIPAIKDLDAKDVFSEKVFFMFMYEMIGGLMKKEIIKI